MFVRAAIRVDGTKILSLRSTPTALRLKRHSLKASRIWSVKRKKMFKLQTYLMKVQTTMHVQWVEDDCLVIFVEFRAVRLPKQIEIRFKIFTSTHSLHRAIWQAKCPYLQPTMALKIVSCWKMQSYQLKMLTAVPNAAMVIYRNRYRYAWEQPVYLPPNGVAKMDKGLRIHNFRNPEAVKFVFNLLYIHIFRVCGYF